MRYLSTLVALLWLGPVLSFSATAAPLGVEPTQLAHLSFPQRSVHDATIKPSNTSIVELEDTVAEVGSLPKRSDASAEAGEIVDEPGALP